MTNWDKDYLELCKRILTTGVEVENRTGINTIKVPSHHFHFDLSEEFPILQTKQLFFKNARKTFRACKSTNNYTKVVNKNYRNKEAIKQKHILTIVLQT